MHNETNKKISHQNFSNISKKQEISISFCFNLPSVILPDGKKVPSDQIASQSYNVRYFKGATKLYFKHYMCMVIILFNTDL